MQVRHLLNHSAGLSNPYRFAGCTPPSSPRASLTSSPWRFSPATASFAFRPAQGQYSNLGYIVLGEVIAAAAQQRYEHYVREHILMPLGMTRTDFSYRDRHERRCRHGLPVAAESYHPSFRRSSQGITGKNEGRFLSFQPFCVDGAATAAYRLGTGCGALRVGPPRQRLPTESNSFPGSVAEMQTITVRAQDGFGLGWFRRHSDRKSDERYLEHLGGGGGLFNMIRIYPELEGSASTSWATPPATTTSRSPRRRRSSARTLAV